MKETEWRDLGVTQSKGWVHYMQHLPGKRVKGGRINEMNKSTFYKERQINKGCFNNLSKLNKKVPSILDTYL